MLIAWAIPGIDSPCCELVEFIKAPVAINKILLTFLFCNCLNQYPEKTVAQHAQPLPPECVSWDSLSNIITPQSL